MRWWLSAKPIGPTTIALIGLGVASSAHAQAAGAARTRTDVAKPRLVDALEEITRETSTDLLFSPSDIGETRAAPVRGHMSVEEALQRLLEGTPFTYRRSSDGTFVILPAAVEQQAVPEILVVGRNTQNIDIPRTENDVQIYQVVSAKELAASHAVNVEDYVRSRISSNMQVLSPGQQPTNLGGTPRSEFSIRAQGEGATLILIDGGRMPRLPNAG